MVSIGSGGGGYGHLQWEARVGTPPPPPWKIKTFCSHSCVPYTIFSVRSKVRLMHTSTVTRSHSCSEKKYVYALRASCFSMWGLFATFFSL